jgi:hypothetical protein
MLGNNSLGMLEKKAGTTFCILNIHKKELENYYTKENIIPQALH